ncbi:beta-ketoacyl-ACP synthase II [Mollicutes bacterium LVI A0078]|nr:beta-ketoacyl-ACP synthase II [Mollicutes bacterium LVI A0075]WOO91803.1 beta-ketoacyl-ACP synthase II [Mollicutes bacterium LVI A0078]
MRKVVITGIGTINSVGLNAADTWEGLKAGKLGISQLPDEYTEETGVKFAGKITDYKATDYFDRKQARRLDKSSQFAIIAAREAATDANLQTIENRARIGVNVTSGIGGIETIEDNILKAADKGFNKISPMFIPGSIVNLVAGNVAIDLNCQGLCIPPVTACASSTDGIGHAAMYIQNGLVDVMVTGGAEAAANMTGLAGFQNMGALTSNETVETACVPFSKDRSGFVMGEGAGALILEEYEHAKARGAKIYGFVEGYGATCDASHITAPDPEAKMGLESAKQAIANAGISASQVGYVNAHGTSTPLNDKGEDTLLNKLYTGDAKPVVTSTKSMTGHLLGATGAVEAIATVLSLQEQICTPTVGTTEIDPDISLDVCLNEAKPLDTDYGISFSLGFGGHNSVVVFKKGE